MEINPEITAITPNGWCTLGAHGLALYYFDQNEISSLDNFPNEYLGNVDVLIDDGLHSIVANINSIYFAEKMLKKGGYLVIEDINKYAEELYQLTLFVASKTFEVNLYTNNSCFVAVLKKN